jgi:hypothetical protein
MTTPRVLSPKVLPLRDVAVLWVQRTIEREYPNETHADQLAENLVAIGEQYRVPDEKLVEWLYFHEPSTKQFLHHAQLYARFLRKQQEGSHA